LSLGSAASDASLKLFLNDFRRFEHFKIIKLIKLFIFWENKNNNFSVLFLDFKISEFNFWQTIISVIQVGLEGQEHS